MADIDRIYADILKLINCQESFMMYQGHILTDLHQAKECKINFRSLISPMRHTIQYTIAENPWL